MSYLEKISERNTGTGSPVIPESEQALPNRELLWPVAQKDPEAAQPNNEWAEIASDTVKSDDRKTVERASIEPSPTELRYERSAPSPYELKPDKTNTPFPSKKESQEPNPVDSRIEPEEPMMLIPRERPPLLEKSIERTVLNTSKPGPESSSRQFDFSDRITGNERQRVVEAKSEKSTTNRENLILPTTTHRSTSTERAIPEKKSLKPFIEPDVVPKQFQKKETEARLIIGRITVEVSQPIAIPVPTASPRPSSGFRSPVSSTYNIDKLSFGLGQL